jgi:hypothetical protein
MSGSLDRWTEQLAEQPTALPATCWPDVGDRFMWSSFFAPWIAEATIAGYNCARFEAHRFLSMLAPADVTSLCAPPTVWRMLIQNDVGQRPTALRRRQRGGAAQTGGHRASAHTMG